MEGGHRTSSRAHALSNPLSTKERVEGLLPDTLLVHIASFSVSPHAVDWRTLLALCAASVSVRATLVCEDAAPVLWRRLVRPPTDAALLLGARGAGFGGPTHVDLSGCAALTDAALLRELANSYTALNLLESAEALFRRSLACEPSAHTRRRLADVLSAQNSLAAAVNEYKAVIEANEDPQEMALAAGECEKLLVALGRSEEVPQLQALAATIQAC